MFMLSNSLTHPINIKILCGEVEGQNEIIFLTNLLQYRRIMIEYTI